MFEVLKSVFSLNHSEAGNHSLESWILNCEDGVLCIDGGMTAKAIEKIQKGLEKLDKKWNDIKIILITHKHGDHQKYT